jgi:hypothetical protein
MARSDIPFLCGEGGVRVMAAVLLVMVVSSGCSSEATKPKAVVPDFVQKLINAPFAADGQVHVQSRGRLVMGDETAVCYFPDGFSINSGLFFPAFGQSPDAPWGDRKQPAVQGRCDFTKDMVLIKGTQTLNRNGKPYKLALAVWQGDVDSGKGAYWVGGVERLEGKRPDILIRSPFDIPGEEPSEQAIVDAQNSALSQYISEDINRISKNFVDQFSGDKK